MKRGLFILIALILVVVVTNLVDAQLINYGRRGKFLDTSPGYDVPEWAKKLPVPQNDEEKKFDTNKDGLLQSAEIKVYLRTIIKRVEARGYVPATTDILKEYDKNNDGVINTKEAEQMKKDVEQ